MDMQKRFSSSRLIASIATPLLALASSATAAPYGTGVSYDQYEGDIVSSPVLIADGIELGRGGVLTITGGTGDDVASVTVPTRGTITAKRGLFTESFDAAAVTKIVFHGNDGNDTFTNSTSIPCEAYGNDGNDTLNGGSGADFLVGGYGQDTLRGYAGADTIWGSGGSDYLYGGTGDDLIKGHGGGDQLYGEDGRDALYGGSGNDTLNGGASQDTLVTIGGDYDTVAGGSSNDFFWVDTTDTVSDATLTETSQDYVNKVASYFSYSYTGGLTFTPVAKDLTDFDLLDPFPADPDVSLDNFADRPLFASAGPSKEDVFQGSTGDCYILGPLSAVADATPDSIRKLVVDLDDGTYAVRFYRTEGGAAQFVRVDADLWTWDSNGGLTYARLGVDDSIWVPIVEKAWAFFRDQEGSYASISGGNSGLGGAIGMGASKEVGEFGAFDAQAIINWVIAGRPAGAVANDVNASVTDLLNWIVDRQAEGRPVYTGYVAGLTNASNFDADNWRRGAHIIMIDSVGFDANGNPISLTIRDQIGGVYRTYTDFARIYFYFGRGVTYDMP